MPEIAPERWGDVYDRAFPQVYRALVATTFDRDRALDGLHDAFEEGLRNPPSDDRNLEGWLYRVALRKTRRGIFRAQREVALDAGSSSDEVAAIIQRLEVGRLLALLTERQRAIVVAHYYLGFTQDEIAEGLGIRRGTVSATVSQSLARMREEGIARG
ncbi:MAG TPA: RNA polymerase sigma factor [Candidatus Saccharimonadales bacterium]|jgi:RNA polymerase sigma factor (sigma-70 family)|nr:RNA polymerase sigma factor [Candidatus Saccharimonadales bacterium]